MVRQNFLKMSTHVQVYQHHALWWPTATDTNRKAQNLLFQHSRLQMQNYIIPADSMVTNLLGLQIRLPQACNCIMVK